MGSILFQASVTVGSHTQKTGEWSRVTGERQREHGWPWKPLLSRTSWKYKGPVWTVVREKGWILHLPHLCPFSHGCCLLAKATWKPEGKEVWTMCSEDEILNSEQIRHRKKDVEDKVAYKQPLLVPSWVCCRKTLDVSNEENDCSSLFLFP